MFRDISNESYFMKVFRFRLLVSIKKKVSIEHWWRYTDRAKSNYSERNLSLCHFVHHKSNTNCPGIEARPPRREAAD
jgi:hypothetical protein